MTPSDFRPVAPVKINGRTMMLYQHIRLNWWRFGGRNVNAPTQEKAIEKLTEAAVRGPQRAAV